MTPMKRNEYGHRVPDIPDTAICLAWISGVRRLQCSAARRSFWHSHREMTVLFCLSGEFTYEFPDNRRVLLSSGSFIAIPPGIQHRHYQAVDPVGLRVELLLEPGRSSPCGFGVFSRQSVKSMMQTLAHGACASRPYPASLASGVKRLASLAGRQNKDWSELELAEIRLICSQMLLECSSLAESGDERKNSTIIDQTVAWMEHRLADRISVADIIAHVGYSRTHVFSLFKRHAGLSPADCLLRLRLRRARHLLETTDMKSGEIAVATGFSSSTKFSSTFRRHCGCSPLEWRTARDTRGTARNHR